MLHDGKKKRDGGQELSPLDMWYHYNDHPFSKKSARSTVHPDLEDESINLPSQETHDPILETRVLRYI